MKKTTLIGLTIALLAIPLLAKSKKRDQKPELKTVSAVNLDKYLGKWYEIARLPNSFQEKCAGNVTANYSKRENGNLSVVNSCLKKTGKTETAEGEARIADKTSNAKLKVRFAPKALSFLPFVWGDYWIIALDAENYQYAMIGEPSRKYLWILSRSPQMDEAEVQKLLDQASAQGFDTAKVRRTSQK